MIDVRYFETKQESGSAAAALGAEAIRQTIAARGSANIVIATGASQFEMLEALVAAEGIDWSRVTAFHLDEYIGMPDTHPASFRRYLKERFTGRLPALGAFHFVEGDAPDLAVELTRINALIDRHPIDVTFAGIGENGHLAFNDPPADFESTVAYKVVELDERCRRQQFGEGWFPTFDDVPTEAISMTVQRILSSRAVILTVPDERKAEAVQHVLEGPVTNMWPASILQQHPACHLFLDRAAASRLAKKPTAADA
ncbi:glucosamine-6-phosphate deaminase [Ancylobacter mangrovi]|uniref:glucosamine-6-phosphate deaminase n=1 Tax=Ancylobacter mangrovi TaxID=2972472 RepID=UPI002163D0CD|nr:glucosamine-6-phosphate deaminase [Ancylobacter mangrovi]MCS0502849.1 glucosamine-6-phosphate deaminase [Ancylobacter mangrovi]